MQDFNRHYFWHSVRTWSYWKYALFSLNAGKAFLSSLGTIWLFLEMLRFFRIINQSDIPKYGIFCAIFFSIFIVIIIRRPIAKICYKLKRKDMSIEVVISDLFSIEGQKIISTNTTFDTETENGLIAADSLQGQFAKKYFPENIKKLDQEIEQALDGRNYSAVENPLRKNKRYDIGTVAKIMVRQEIFYLLAMGELNRNGTAETSLPFIRTTLDKLWHFISSEGENYPVVIPLLGTGRGRITTSRKKMIEIHAQSFINASKDRIFSNKLIITIWPDDAKNFEINLLEIKDYLTHSLEY